MTTEEQALFLNAIPLLVLGSVYLFAGASLVPSLLRERRRIRELELALALVFPCGGAAAFIFGLLILSDREPVGGNPWLGLLATVLALGPALAFFARFRERTLMLTAPRRVREAEARDRLHEARTLEDASRVLLDRACEMANVELAGLATIDQRANEVVGILGRSGGEDVQWWTEMRIDLEAEASGVASAFHDGASFSVYDAQSSRVVNPRVRDRAGVRSVAFVPLIDGERVIAVLVVASLARHRAFSAGDLGELDGLARAAAPAVARFLDVEDVAPRRRRLGSLLADRVRAGLDVDDLLRVGVDEIAASLAADRCLVRVCEDDGALPVRAEWPHAEAEAKLAAASVSNVVARERRTVAVADVATAPELDDDALGGRQTLLELGSRAVLAVPLVASEQLLGVLEAHRSSPGTWPPGDVSLAETAAAELALALQAADLLAERSRQAQIQRGFYRIASVLARPLSVPQTLDAIARAAADAFGGDFVAVLAPRAAAFEVVGSFALPDDFRDQLAATDDGGALQLAAAEGRVLASRALGEDPRFPAAWRSAAERGIFRSLLVVPVDAPADERASLVVVFFCGERALVDDDLELARHLAGAARAALERSELFEAERTSRSLAQQLARTRSLLAAELDPAAVIDEVVEQAPALLGADACAVRLIEGDELVVTATTGDETDVAVGTRTAAVDRLSGEVVQTRRAVAIEDASREAALVDADPVLAAGYAAYLGTPLVGPEGTLHGVISLYSTRPRRWRPEEIDALAALAANTSAALSNAELYQRVALEKERSAAILDNIADGIVAVDREGNVVLWNRAAEQVTGVPTAEALNHPPERVLGRSLVGASLVPIVRGGGEIWLSVTEAVMRDPAGLVAGRIFAFRDISADRLVEELKSEFVATVSHDLRGPLTSIWGFAETLLREDVLFAEEERKVFLRYIKTEAERLTKSVERLLSVARLESGDVDVELAPTDLAPLVSEVVAGMQGNGSNGHRFVLDLPPEPLAAEADASKLRQVLEQLLDNAVKYSPAGATVTVGARRKSDTVEVHVSDQGAGVPAGERERIFRKFYRADQDHGGTGLGLFFAQKLVAAMGGRIWVDSDEGRGARFAFELPAARV